MKFHVKKQAGNHSYQAGVQGMILCLEEVLFLFLLGGMLWKELLEILDVARIACFRGFTS